MTSVYKGMDVAVDRGDQGRQGRHFSNEPYVGTLENGGTGLAPFHDFDSKVPAELKAEIDALKARHHLRQDQDRVEVHDRQPLRPRRAEARRLRTTRRSRSLESPRTSSDEAGAAGHHQAVRVASAGQRPHRPGHRAGRDPLPARGERGRQVDADEHAVRAAAARRGRDPHRRRRARQSATPSDAIAAGIGMVHQHFMLVAGVHRGRERDARPGAGHAPGVLNMRQAPATVARAVASATASTSIRTRWWRTSRSACSSGWRSSRRWPTTPRYLIFDEPTAVLTPQEIDELIDGHAVAARRGQGDRLHHPQAARGARDRGQDHRDPARQGRRHRRSPPTPRPSSPS